MHPLKFIGSVRDEMHRVVWPTAKENRRDTTIVLILFFALFGWLIHLLVLLFV